MSYMCVSMHFSVCVSSIIYLYSLTHFLAQSLTYSLCLSLSLAHTILSPSHSSLITLTLTFSLTLLLNHLLTVSVPLSLSLAFMSIRTSCLTWAVAIVFLGASSNLRIFQVNCVCRPKIYRWSTQWKRTTSRRVHSDHTANLIFNFKVFDDTNCACVLFCTHTSMT